ncbi:hypothetical protein AArc1_1282 [Natrarchaeobaculum sulfurireducens]|uniref:Uncharacterized protein n=1 Tax=Natrarchaeobaculum sulfurireducens TaxID=2044521 RepID=A0A346PDM6_9EURY|nr:hypothetical protein AArc1_1282 [Natrarchaeobaculum sulfurireducens]
MIETSDYGSGSVSVVSSNQWRYRIGVSRPTRSAREGLEKNTTTKADVTRRSLADSD